MRLHHRVRVRSWREPWTGRRLWTWTCPGCHWAGYPITARLAAIAAGRHHAIECEHLRALNRQTAYACRNCDGSGIAGPSDCPACLGRGWVC